MTGPVVHMIYRMHLLKPKLRKINRVLSSRLWRQCGSDLYPRRLLDARSRSAPWGP
jgi:hypothetical protein